jgi:hypothetical protein
MSYDPTRIERVRAAISTHSTIDTREHEKRILDVVDRALRPAPRSGPYGPSESSPTVPKQEAGP